MEKSTPIELFGVKEVYFVARKLQFDLALRLYPVGRQLRRGDGRESLWPRISLLLLPSCKWLAMPRPFRLA
jgi:hypothetical protein